MPTQERVREMFNYRPDGRLVLRIHRSCRNTIGDLVGTINASFRHRRIRVDGKYYDSRKIVTLWHHGYFPTTAKYINGIEGDDRIENIWAEKP